MGDRWVVDHRYYEASTLTNLGDTHHSAGNAAARDAWRQALTILEQLDHPDTDRVAPGSPDRS